MVFKSGDNGFDNAAMWSRTAADVDVSLRVKRLALLRQPSQGAGAVAPPKQWPGIAPPSPFRQHLDRRIQPDGDGAIIEQFASARVNKRAASRRDDAHGSVHQPRDEAALAITEVIFAIALEQLCGRCPRGLLNRRARRRPTVDLPAPISPTNTIGRSNLSVSFCTMRGYT